MVRPYLFLWYQPLIPTHKVLIPIIIRPRHGPTHRDVLAFGREYNHIHQLVGEWDVFGDVDGLQDSDVTRVVAWVLGDDDLADDGLDDARGGGNAQEDLALF